MPLIRCRRFYCFIYNAKIQKDFNVRKYKYIKVITINTFYVLSH